MEDQNLEYELEKGIRFVVGYKTSNGSIFYLTKLSRSPEKAHQAALNMIKDKPMLAERISLLKVKAFGQVEHEKGDVMLWTRNPRFFDMERIYENKGLAQKIAKVQGLDGQFMISPFTIEVIRYYKK